MLEIVLGFLVLLVIYRAARINRAAFSFFVACLLLGVVVAVIMTVKVIAYAIGAVVLILLGV